MSSRAALRENPPGVSLLLAAGLLLAFVATAALVPDEAVFRAKLFWSRGLLLLSGAAVLLGQALGGRLQAPHPGLLLASLGPALVAIGWLALGDPTSAALARDEVGRLVLFPAALWAAGSTLAWAPARRATLMLIGAVSLVVGIHALAQNLAGVLELPIDREPRSFSTFGNPVMLGAYLVLVLPFLVLHATYSRGSTRWLHAIAAGFCLPALLTTGTRSAWLGFLVALLTGVTLLAPTRRHRVGLLLAIAVFGGALFVFKQPDLGRESAHPLIWRDSLAMVAEHPTGVGPGQFLVEFLPYASTELLDFYPRASHTINDVHSEPLQVLVELGWLGLVAFLIPLGLLVRAVISLLRSSALDDSDRLLVTSGAAALAGALVQSFISPDLRFGISPMIVGLVAGMLLSFSPARGFAVPRGSLVLVVAALLWASVAISTSWSGLRLERLVTPDAPDAQLSAAPPIDPATLDAIEKRAINEPDDWTAHFDAGVIRGRAREYGRAALAFRRVLELYPRNLPALRNLGLCEALSSQHDEAMDDLEAYLALNPRDETARYFRARSAWYLGELAVALAETERLLTQNPTHRDGLLLLEKLRE